MSMTPPLHLIPLLLIFLLPPSHGSHSIPCPSSPCEQPLTCDQGNQRCVCPHNHLLTWDPATRQCSLMENAPCGQSASSSLSLYNCITHTSCTFDPSSRAERCVCIPGYLRDGLGKCSLSHGRRCDSSLPHQPTCAARYFLQCSRDVKECRCVGEGLDYVWDADRLKCVSLVDGRCDQVPPFDDDRLECVRNAKCNSRGRCECSAGWIPGPLPNGKGGTGCLVDYGHPCNGVSGVTVIEEDENPTPPLLCDSSKLLFCTDSKVCGCEFHGQMEWTEEGCVMLAGEFCDLDQDEGRHKCVEGAVCVRKGGKPNKGQKGVCTCVEGKFASASRHCTPIRRHGFECSLAADCDSASFLTCVVGADSGVCDCEPNSMIWNGGGPEEGRCVVLPGHSCSRNPSCGPNSFCFQGFCTCDEGYFQDSGTGNCVPGLMTPMPLPSSNQSFTIPTITVKEDSLPVEDDVGTDKGPDIIHTAADAAVPYSSSGYKFVVHPLLVLICFNFSTLVATTLYCMRIHY